MTGEHKFLLAYGFIVLDKSKTRTNKGKIKTNREDSKLFQL